MNEAIKVENAVSVRAQAEAREGKGAAKIPADDMPFYADRVRVYPRRVKGVFRKLKWAALFVLLAIYYGTPWIRWDRGPNAPDQAVLVDLDGRRFYFFWIEIWPQEIYYAVGLLVLAAFGIFLATALAGRVWCGYACPQTVWTDLFMWVERLIEGDRNRRIMLDRGSLTVSKATKKVVKHAAWVVIAALTGGAWVIYFQDAPTLARDLFAGQLSLTTTFFIGLLTFTTYMLAGWAREQVCTFMCPWPRFQAAMFDTDTLIVTYQGWRGEPRGKMTPKPDWSARGDCVDCNACVAVCPTGIDIRDGQQLECISCALCVDACNAVMTKVGRPANLIGYDTDRRAQARAAGQPLLYRILRPRTAIYGLLMVAVGAVMLVMLASRTDIEINALHDRNPLFVRLSDGGIRNGYIIKILNKLAAPRFFSLTVSGVPGATMQVVGQTVDAGAAVILEAKPDRVAEYKIYLKAPAGVLKATRTDVSFLLTDSRSGAVARRTSFFHGPAR
ncbi:MAG TPA: cytochrome c oxidase accessory protein CcoG [Alphaproteobacteria bacterium]|nr:cytochrome c oxidase accessory protein CcoG [Alphaproteobacteria bacterium]